jgi:hypothetical protein
MAEDTHSGHYAGRKQIGDATRSANTQLAERVASPYLEHSLMPTGVINGYAPGFAQPITGQARLAKQRCPAIQ